MRTALVLTCVATILALGTGVARRGGNGSGDSAEGFWMATTPTGVNVKWAILDGGETWGIYDTQGTILGAFHGQTQAANGVLHGTGLAFDIPSHTLGATRFTGSYLARQVITLTTAAGVTISGHYVAGHDRSARLVNLQGRYRGEGLSSRSPVIGMTLHVASDGAFVMTSRADCAASGTAMPRPRGQQVFDVHLRFAGSACALGDGATATGIAHVGTASGEVFLLAMNAARTDAWLYLGARARD
jgi:hypothetical protein